jgi:hypothetical protein
MIDTISSLYEVTILLKTFAVLNFAHLSVREFRYMYNVLMYLKNAVHSLKVIRYISWKRLWSSTELHFFFQYLINYSYLISMSKLAHTYAVKNVWSNENVLNASIMYSGATRTSFVVFMTIEYYTGCAQMRIENWNTTLFGSNALSVS